VLKKPVNNSSSLIMSQELINSSHYIDEILPSVMTCQNYVKLPAYSSYEALKVKFEQAYTEGCNNFTLS
jgi:E3 ubiquitin-protein ligase TRIP12